MTKQNQNNDWIVDVLVELQGYCDAKGMSAAAARLVETISEIRPHVRQDLCASNVIHLIPTPRRETLHG